jgi:crossover junction endodeoxyribonuclease RuvC
MRILGIDCGCDSTGYGIIDTDGRTHRMVVHGAIRTSSKQPFAERLRKISAALIELIQQWSPEEVAVEEVFFAANAKSALKLGHVRGVALLEAARAGFTVAEYSALEVKSSVVGYGRAEKQPVQQMVKVLLNLSAVPESEDAADALALAICHAHRSHAQAQMAAALIH